MSSADFRDANDFGAPYDDDIEIHHGTSWAALDIAATVAAVIDGTITTPKPTIGRRSDGQALFYPGKVNGIAGASNAGKSWTAFYACAQEIGNDNHVVYLDLEDDMAAAVGRLVALGVPAETIIARFHYVQPDERYTDEAARHLEQLLTTVRPTLVVIDSTGESMALDGAKPNDDDDVARWFRRLPTSIARTSGAAVAVLDHVTKAEDGGLWPIGSQRKRAAISGAQYMQIMVKPFDRVTTGYSKLVCAKDRHGNYHQGQTVALLHIAPHDEGVEIDLRVPADASSGIGNWRPTGLMELVSVALEEAGEALSFNKLTGSVKGKDETIRKALNVLVKDGNVTVTDGPNRSKLHHIVRPYRQTEDPAADVYRGPGHTQPPESASSVGAAVSPPMEEGGRHHPQVDPGHTGDTPGHTGHTGVCGHHDCTQEARANHVMCALHFTREPALTLIRNTP